MEEKRIELGTFTVLGSGDFTADCKTIEEGEGIIISRLHFTWKECKEIKFEWWTPIVDINGRWHPDCRHDRSLLAEWMSWPKTMTSYSMPLHSYYNDKGVNRYSFALSETRKELIVNSGVHEETGRLHNRIYVSLPQFGNLTEFTVDVMERTVEEPFEDTVRALSLWQAKEVDVMPVPESAKEPMYSTWYSFHQNMTAEEIEAECRIAKELGFSTIIVDDGWQTEDNNRGYAFCGEYEVAKKKFPDMKEHVERVHQMGMKYMVWLSVPFLGNKSKVWDRFKDKILRFDEAGSAGILDPRYREVREFLIDLYKRTVTDFNLDGLKLDFIDQFQYSGIEPNDQMDEICVQDAVVRLMTEVRHALEAIKPDIMIEFRQRYIGPNMRQFGNMFRVNDCPNDYLTNRICSVDLRLSSGETAVHSDMLMWHKDETPEAAARQILNVLFSVLQFSVKLGTLPEEHKKMVRFWVSFMDSHRDLLLSAPIYGESPHLLYPVVRTRNGEEEVVAVYEENRVLRFDDVRTHYIVNATHSDYIYLELSEDITYKISAFNTLGEKVQEETVALGSGLHKISVPESGLLAME